jgi:hypothetical protein
MAVLNLTQHNATKAQKKAGVHEPNVIDKKIVRKALTFDTYPSDEEIERRARQLALFASSFFQAHFDEDEEKLVMVGGALYLMLPLVRMLKERGLSPVTAFSQRQVIERVEGDTVVKETIFQFGGFKKL